jgi:hypothetical protein
MTIPSPSDPALVRLLLTLLLLTLSMLSSMALGSPEKWMLLATGTSWAPLLSLILVPLLTGRPLMNVSLTRRAATARR